MRLRALFIGFGISLLVTASGFAQTLGAVLTPGQEVPPCSSSGFGNATVTFDSTRQNITVTITVANLGSPIIAAHIHKAVAGVQGDVVLGFTPPGSFTNGTLTGTFPITSDLATAILQNPSNYYINVHTTACSDGAARGQLSLAGGNVVMFASELRPQNEVPPATSTAFGSALSTFDIVNNTIAWEVNSSGIVSPSLSHIHRGIPSVAGPVIINFATNASQIVGGHTRGFDSLSTPGRVTSNFQASDLTTLAAGGTQSGYYVNLHSSAFPGGEIRGILQPVQEVDIPIAGHVTNGIGQTFISDVRIFNPSFDSPTVALVEFFPAGSTANTNASTSLVVNLPARGTAVLNDVAGTGLNTTGLGAIRISSVANVIATSRVFVNTANGSFGQFVPAFNRSSALRRGVMPQASNTSAAGGFRANVGFFNPNPSSVTVRIEARDPGGVLVASNVVSLAGLSAQLNAIGTYFPGVDVSNASNLTVSFDASAPIFVFVSEVDNASGDSFLIPALPDTGVAASQ